MTNNLTHWFTTGTERTISNERAIQSAIKLEKLLNKNYDCLRQLSLSNVWELRKLNELFEQYNRIDSSLNMPILTAKQLNNVSYLLAGAAGEQLVTQTINKIRNSKKVIFHNVVLPYQYGRDWSRSDNQIDNLVVADTGIFALEVKARSIDHGTFDFRALSSKINDQLAFHKEAILDCLADAKIDIPSTAVKTFLVIVDRTGAIDFEIINQGQLLHSGSAALKLNELNLRISNGETNTLFTTEQVQQIARVIRTGAVSDRRRYKDNVTFNLTSDDLEKINQVSMACRHHVPTDQIVTYHNHLNKNPLIGLSGPQQNAFWYIVGKAYGQGGSLITLTKNELKDAIFLPSKSPRSLDNTLVKVAAFMKETGLFVKAEYSAGIMKVAVDKKLSRYNGDLCSWNYNLLHQIKYKWAKTLFRLLVSTAEYGSCRLAFQDLRYLLAIPPSYRNHKVASEIIRKSVIYLAPFFRGLSYRFERGKSNQIIGVAFTYQAHDMLNLEWKNRFLNNIESNPILTNEEKGLARKIFDENFLGS
ncbi:Replication protein [Lactobacillus equicursoris 66c]|uniref:Replication protein n=1 Tax=Lactobacillus equicursoris 66c TaxID=872326 RepID=K0NGR5_9LACO|nr:NERD domain-containing protein [Lactobacillus equicursoris]CCK84527.1 Replication protein [Lactobacillus equicursoris 66c]